MSWLFHSPETSKLRKPSIRPHFIVVISIFPLIDSTSISSHITFWKPFFYLSHGFEKDFKLHISIQFDARGAYLFSSMIKKSFCYVDSAIRINYKISSVGSFLLNTELNFISVLVRLDSSCRLHWYAVVVGVNSQSHWLHQNLLLTLDLVSLASTRLWLKCILIFRFVWWSVNCLQPQESSGERMRRHKKKEMMKFLQQALNKSKHENIPTHREFLAKTQLMQSLLISKNMICCSARSLFAA